MESGRTQKCTSSDRILFLLTKAVAALWAFGFGFIFAGMVSFLLEAKGEVPKDHMDESLWKIVMEFMFSLFHLALCVAVGVVTSIISLFIRPHFVFRLVWLAAGLLALALGIIGISVGTATGRFFWGPLLVLASIYMTWMALRGSESDVEQPPF